MPDSRFPPVERKGKMYCYGIPVEELTKEELIDALYILDRDLKNEQEIHSMSLSILGAVSRAKAESVK